MKRYSMILAAAVLLAGCEEFGPVFTGQYAEPEESRVYTDEDFSDCRLVTIQDVKDIYDNAGGPVIMTDDIYIKGRVSTSDKVGNFYRSFYIQDESAGIEIKIGKTGLYNTYKPGQWVYVRCKGLTVGSYEGAKQIGYEDITGEYESAYIDIQLIIDNHVFRGEKGEPVTPADLSEVSDLFVADSKGKLTVLNEKYVGKLVKVSGLTYANGIFCLAYVNPDDNKKATSNRIFLDNPLDNSYGDGGPSNVGAKLSDGTLLKKNWSVDTWAMSKAQFEKYLANGNFDGADIGNGPEKVSSAKSRIVPSAYSVSQYFKVSGYASNLLAIRSSGYAKFADTRLPSAVLSGSQKVNVVGIMGVYDGEAQMTLVDLSGVTRPDGTPWYDSSGNLCE